MNIKSAIFDFDGTLFDSMSIWETVGERYLSSLGKTPSPTLYNNIKNLSLPQAATYIKNTYLINSSEAEIISGITKTAEGFYLHEIRPKPGVIEFLHNLKDMGAALCIATASDRSLIEAALDRCKMRDLFKAIFTCGEIGHGKDEPAIYRAAMEHTSSRRSDTVIFEDAFHAAQTAKNDGFIVTAVYDASEEHRYELQSICDFYIYDFKDLSPFWRYIKNKE